MAFLFWDYQRNALAIEILLWSDQKQLRKWVLKA